MTSTAAMRAFMETGPKCLCKKLTRHDGVVVGNVIMVGWRPHGRLDMDMATTLGVLNAEC